MLSNHNILPPDDDEVICDDYVILSNAKIIKENEEIRKLKSKGK